MKPRADHSQYGELGLLLPHLTGKVRHKLVVDVGANGRDGSNSFDLIRDCGWKGVLIEANPALWQRIEQDFAGLDFTLLRTAVSDKVENRDLLLGVDDRISSFLQKKVENFGPVIGRIPVSCQRLPALLEEVNVPHDFDLLSIDIEWMDLPVFNDLVCSSPYRPGFVIIEASKKNTGATLDYLDFADEIRTEYQIVERSRINLLLKHRER